MIRYALACAHAHPFEAWFASSADYDDQARKRLVECPFCGSSEIAKQIMAPAVARGASHAPPAVAPTVVPQPNPAEIVKALTEARRHVEANFDYVGDRFAREARDIHEGVAPARPVYGEATPREVRDLVADGVPVAPLPAPPRLPDKARLN